MRKLLLALALLLTPAAAAGQGNPQCPTRPVGDSTNACASTRFVQNAVSSIFILPETYGAVVGGNGVTNTAAIQAAIDAAKTTGKTVLLSGSYPVCEAVGAPGYVLLIDSTIVMMGIGTAGNVPTGKIVPSSSCVGAGVDIIKVRGASQSALNYMQLENFSIGNPSTPVGNRGIYIETPTGRDFGYATFRKLTIYGNNSGYGIYQYNDGTNAFGGMYLARFEDNVIVGAVRFEKTGSDNLLLHNYIFGAVSGVSVYFSQIAGGTGVLIEANNIADTGGAIKVDSGNNIIIRSNSVEATGTVAGSNGALIDINGGTAMVDGVELYSNRLANFSSSASLLSTVRVNAAVVVHIGTNNWGAGPSTPQVTSGNGKWVTITASATYTSIDETQSGSWLVDLPFASWLSDAGGFTTRGITGVAAKKQAANTYLMSRSTATTWNSAVQHSDGTNTVYAGLMPDAGCGIGSWAVFTSACSLTVTSSGAAKAPTPAAGDNSTNIATTAWVRTAAGLNRIPVDAPLTLHVDVAGNDANDCLTTLTACATFARASLVLTTNYIINNQRTIIQADSCGTYSTFGIATNYIGTVNSNPGAISGNEPAATFTIPTIRGDPTNLACVVLDGGGTTSVTFVGTTLPWFLSGVTIQNTGTAPCVLADAYTNLYLGAIAFKCNIGVQGQWNAFAEHVRNITWEIHEPVTIFARAQENSVILDQGSFPTLVGTPSFAAFAVANNGSTVSYAAATFTGTATGPKYLADTGSTVESGSLLPGDAAGQTNGTLDNLAISTAATFSGSSSGSTILQAPPVATGTSILPWYGHQVAWWFATTRAVDANYTILPTDLPVLKLTTSLGAARTWELPLAASVPVGAKLTFVDGGGISSSNTLTIQRQGANTFAGLGVTANAITLATTSSWLTVVSDGVSAWSLVGSSALPVTAVTGFATGVVAALQVNVGTAGAFVVNGGALGTPSSGTLTSATGLPISTGVSGLGTGVATALAANVGSTGAPVTFNGALGTPSSGTLTSATGLPISTGVSGLGTNVATFLTTPSSANLAAALTDESGTGVVPFQATGSWTPSDVSGASLTFTGVSANYTKIGNIVHAYATVTYPATADASAAVIGGLPFNTANAEYARQCSVGYTTAATAVRMLPGANSTAISITNSAGASILNSAMSLAPIYFICIYPVS